jgi:hypothetical protein
VHPDRRRVGELVADGGHVLHDGECAHGLFHCG